MTIAGEVRSKVAAMASRFRRAKPPRPAPDMAAPIPTTQEVPLQGALEGPPFFQWNKRGPILASAKKLGRTIFLANIPLRMQLPPRPNNLREICFRTVPRATKLEVKRVLQLVYGMDVEKVHTINMDSKKKFNPKRKYYYRTASYKKCYVYLRRPISLSPDLFPLNLFYGDNKDFQVAPAANAKELEEANAKALSEYQEYKQQRKQRQQQRRNPKKQQQEEQKPKQQQQEEQKPEVTA